MGYRAGELCRAALEEPMEPWMQREIDSLVAEHGTVPPLWVMFDEHPYSICWRVGGGESHQCCGGSGGRGRGSPKTRGARTSAAGRRPPSCWAFLLGPRGGSVRCRKR